MGNKYRISEIANILGVSQTTIYKKAAGMKARLKPHQFRERGVIIFDEVALSLFRDCISTADKDVIPAEKALGQDCRMESIEKALLAMAEKMTAMVESNRVLIEENRSLRQEILSLQKCLEYKKPEPAHSATGEESLNSSPSPGLGADPREGHEPARSEVDLSRGTITRRSVLFALGDLAPAKEEPLQERLIIPENVPARSEVASRIAAPVRPPVQREISAWERITGIFDDVFGLCFGRG